MRTILVAAFLSLAAFVRAQESDMDIAALQGIFSAAMDSFDSPNQPASIAEFTKIVEALRGRSGLSPETAILLKKALEYRARALYNKGDDAACDADLRELVALDPAYEVKREEVSPKFYKLYDGIRGNLIGFLRVASVPAGATVYLDGTSIGSTDLADRPAVAGPHRIRLSRKGFEEVVQEIMVEPRQTLTLNYPLTRTAASLSVTTVPAGVLIAVDGQPAGRTPESESETSSPLLIDGLNLGQHVLEFSRPCYETLRRSVTIEAVQDLEIPTVLLENSTATLTITSSLTGGEAFIDGQRSLGPLPIETSTVCSGDHVVDVTFPAGKFSQAISLKKGEAVRLKAEPRPTLVFLGIASDPELAPQAREREKQLDASLRGVTTLNVVAIGYADGQKLIRKVGLSSNSFLAQNKPQTEEQKKLFVESLKRLCGEAKGEMVALGFLSRERIQEFFFLNFAAPPSSSVESIYINPATDELSKLIATLNQPFSIHRSWIGCRTIDLRGSAGPVVLSVAPEGPAAAARMSVGQVVLEVAGKPVTMTAQLQQAIQEVKPGEKLLLKIRGPKKESPPQTIELTVGASPQEIPLATGSLLVSRIVAELGILIKGGSGGLARFLLGQCFMRTGEYQSAYEEMQMAQMGQTWGISDGTVAYYKGRVLLQLGYKPEAAAAFRQALSFPRATVYDNDGKPVADLAQRYLRDLAP